MRIAVTGGTGFIGRHVVRAALRRGHDVRVLARHASAASPDAVAFAAVDLRNALGLAAALRDCDVVIHCAAAMGGDLAMQEAVTVGGTRNLLHAMAEVHVRRIVLISSFAVYDYFRLSADSLLDESAPLEQNATARAPYIGVKQRQEQLVQQASTIDCWTTLRPGIVFGPGRTWFHQLGVQLSPRLWLSLASESPLPLTHVDNCAEAIVLACETRACGTTLNLVDNDLPARGRYLRQLAALSTPRPRVINLPWRVLDLLARTTSRVQHTLLRERLPLPDLLRQPSLHARCKPLQYSNTRARQVLGWEPRLGWQEGLQKAAGAQPTSAG